MLSFAYYVSETLASSLFLEQSLLFSISEPAHVLLPVIRMFSPISSDSIFFFFKYHLKVAFLDRL